MGYNSFLPVVMWMLLAHSVFQCAVMRLFLTLCIKNTSLFNLEISVYDFFISLSSRISLSSIWMHHFLIFWDSQIHKGMTIGNGLIRHLTFYKENVKLVQTQINEPYIGLCLHRKCREILLAVTINANTNYYNRF